MAIGTRATGLALAAVLLIAGCMDTPKEQPAAPTPGPFVFVVETLSIGKGVPDGARRVLAESRGLLEARRSNGQRVALAESHIGLEGETRLRVEFADAALGREAFERIKALAAGVELVTVKQEDEAAPEGD